MKNNKRESNKESPPCTVTLLNEPNFELMAKAFRDLYYAVTDNKKQMGTNLEEQENKLVLGIPDVMKLMGIGRIYAEKIMWGNYFPTIQVGNRRLVHKEVLEQWIKKGTDIINVEKDK